MCLRCVCGVCAYGVCVCMCMLCMCVYVVYVCGVVSSCSVAVRGQLAVSLLPPCGFQRSNSNCQAWQQEPSPTETSFSPQSKETKSKILTITSS